MNNYLNTTSFQVMLTLIIYWLATLFYKRFKNPLIHPGIISIATLIIFLKITSISFKDFNQNLEPITFWLGPSVVALGYPIYIYIHRLKGHYIRVLLAIFSGSIAGIISVVAIAKIFGASNQVILSLASKSITTPIAMEITKGLGGIPSLTIVCVFITGFTGALFGELFLKLIKIKNDAAIGISTGVASHAIGTAEIVKNGNHFGAFGALGLAINGVITAIIAPILVPFLLLFLNWL